MPEQRTVGNTLVRRTRHQEEAREPERRFVELPAPSVQNDLVATFRIGEASLDVYSGASAEVLAVLCKVLSNVK